MTDADLFPDGEIGNAAELGAIDDQSVRIWVRAPGETTIRGELFVQGRQPVSAATSVSAATDWTGALVLRLPDSAPGVGFTCSVLGKQLAGTLAPVPGTPSALTFGFGSCHLPFRVRDGKLTVSEHARRFYPAMSHELREARAARLLLVGDQVYSDGLKPVSVTELLPDDEHDTSSVDATVNLYRRVYRGFFGESGMRAMRETFPTMCVWDDGDVYDNWGSVRNDRALDQRLFAAASRAYCEYQHTRNPDGVIGAPPYHYRFGYGDIGFFVLDLRGVRNAANSRLMGDEQWQVFSDFLNGEASRAFQTLFVVCSVPVAHGSRWFARLGERLPERLSGPVRERWVSRNFVASRDALLDALFDWQSRVDRRQVIILSGDVHCASAFTITRRDGPGVIQQFTSSAMTTPLTFKQAFFNRIAVRAPNLFEPHYRFHRRLLSITHNFGIVRIEPHDAGGHRVTLTIRAWDKKRMRMRTAGKVTSVAS